MALIKCPECGNEISDIASKCPRCGFPMRDYLQYVADEKRKKELEERRLREEAEAERIRKEKEKLLRNKPCPECGKIIGDVKICPFCGVDVKEKEDRDAREARERARKIEEQRKLEEQLKQEDYSKNVTNEMPKQYNKPEPQTQQSVPRCPTCGSINVKPISGVDRVVSTSLWGLASKKINKTYKCNDCGYTW